MTPEALRLADQLEWADKRDVSSLGLRIKAAAELRNLHAANIDCVDHFNVLMEERNHLHALNAELLEALKKTTKEMGHFSAKDVCDAAHHRKIDQHGAFSKCPVAERFLDVYNHANAAIAKAEGEQA